MHVRPGHPLEPNPLDGVPGVAVGAVDNALGDIIKAFDPPEELRFVDAGHRVALVGSD